MLDPEMARLRDQIVARIEEVPRRVRDPERIGRILDMVGELWRRHPDLRLGQLLMNAIYRGDQADADPFYVEDDALEGWLKAWALGPHESEGADGRP